MRAAVQGLFEFLYFCQDFKLLLERSARYEILCSGFWHNCCYWIEAFDKKIGPVLDGLTDTLLISAVPPRDARQSASGISELRDCLKFLLNAEHGRPILRELAKLDSGKTDSAQE